MEKLRALINARPHLKGLTPEEVVASYRNVNPGRSDEELIALAIQNISSKPFDYVEL